MDTTEIIKNALDWADKRLELTDQKLTDEQRNYITFALRQNLVDISSIQNVNKCLCCDETKKLTHCEECGDDVGIIDN